MEHFFSSRVINWYLAHKRDLPWREISDPYKIWVSEIILQQTRIVQGLDYYLRFIDKFPNVESLATASEDEVLLQWQGLGYYSRARNMHKAAQEIMSDFGGKFPTDYEGIRSLKGVGDYTAAAIASFAYNLPHAVLDGNVFRVLSRYFAIDTPIDSTKGKKEFAELSQKLLDKDKPGLFNQGLMDLGATICLPSSPKCDECPICNSCVARNSGCSTDFPIKTKKLTQKDRFFVYFIIKDKNGDLLLHRREGKDIWQGLYEFPLVELSQSMDTLQDLSILSENLAEFSSLTIKRVCPEIKHVLSHQCIHAWFIEADGIYEENLNSKYIPVSEPQLSNYAVSRLTEIYLEQRK